MPKSIVHDQPGIVDEVSFQTLAENTPIGIYKTDASGQRTYVNKKWGEITGRPVNEAYGFGWTQAIISEDRQRVIDTWKKAVANQTDFKLEFRFDNPVTGIRWVRNQATPLRDSEGKITGYIGSVEDITEQKSAEEKLRNSEKLYQLLSANSSEVTLLSNAEKKLVYVSPSVTEILGYRPDELLGIPIWEIIAKEDQPTAAEVSKKITEDHLPIARHELRMKKKTAITFGLNR